VGRFDARYLIAFGYFLSAMGLFYMTRISLDMDFKTIMLMRVYQMVGVAFLFVPIQTMCYVGIPPEEKQQRLRHDEPGAQHRRQHRHLTGDYDSGRGAASFNQNQLSRTRQFRSGLSEHDGEPDAKFTPPAWIRPRRRHGAPENLRDEAEPGGDCSPISTSSGFSP